MLLVIVLVAGLLGFEAYSDVVNIIINERIMVNYMEYNKIN